MQNNISRTETDILKGVAIIMMLWLHLFWVSPKTQL